MSLETDICPVWHEDLTGGQLYQLEQLFNAEYRADEGAWNPDAPYGYAPAELHVMAVEGGRVVGLSLIHISEPTRRLRGSRMPSSG